MRTTAGRAAAIFVGRLTPDPPELFVRYSTLSTQPPEAAAPTAPPVAPLRPPLYPPISVRPGASCEQALQGKVAWDDAGNRSWAADNLERLCRGAADDQPARCFDRVMHGRIDWGGGTRWEWQNAIDLCESTKNADLTIGCFQRYISTKRPLKDAIAACDGRRPPSRPR